MTEPRYSTIRDYLAMLRRQRWVVLGVIVVFVAAAIGLAAAQDKVYSSSASVTFRDISQDLRLLGIEAQPELSSEQRAAQMAEAIMRRSVARRVSEDLGEEGLDADAILGSVTARVASLNALVVIEARRNDAVEAAKIANAFAAQAVREADVDQQRVLEPVIADLRSKVDADDETPSVEEQINAVQLARLRTLSEIARGADIIVRAEAADSPISPKPARNAVIGGFLGLAIALLAAFLRDSLDRRVRTVKDAYEELGYPVLGRIGASAMGAAGGNGRVAMLPQDVEAFRMLRANLAMLSQESDRPVRTLLVTSGLPQEGKSTVAAALASVAAVAGQRVLLVDADLRRAVLASRLGLRQGPGLTDYLKGEATPQDILQIRPLQNGAGPARAAAAAAVAAVPGEDGSEAASETPSLVVITAGNLASDSAQLLATPRCRSFLDKVSRAYELVVIDSGPLLSSADPLELVPQVDAVLVCVRMGTSTRDEVRAVHGSLARLTDRPAGTVITGIGARDHEYGYYGYEYSA